MNSINCQVFCSISIVKMLGDRQSPKLMVRLILIDNVKRGLYKRNFKNLHFVEKVVD